MHRSEVILTLVKRTSVEKLSDAPHGKREDAGAGIGLEPGLWSG